MSDTSHAIQVNLTGQTALVTGASQGIGKAIALALGASGAKVACLARNAEKLAATVNEIESAGGKAMVIACDATDSAAAQAAIDKVVADWGQLDILVNNAGITRDNLLPRMSDDEWDAVIATNLRSVFLFTRAGAQAMMRAKRGRIINISSVSGLMGNPGQANYSASKAGIIGFTQTVARELASKRRKITVNAICPGFIASEMTEALGTALDEMVKEKIPLGRLGEAEEIAQAVLYLASDSGAYVTGQVLTVDGGLTA
ncbi:MAG: 3-oxoacyl-[acyl-carrier-protein] reductase [Aeoliella sp.]